MILDSSGRVNQTAINQARPLGVTGFIRYLGGLDAAERDLILGNHMDLGVVKEWNGNEIGNPSAAGSLAAQACDQAAALGFPHGGMIWLALADEDYRDAGTAQLSISTAVGVCHGRGYQGGIYMSAGLAQATHGWDGTWQTMSRAFWNNSGPWSGSTLLQHFPQPVYGGVQFDENDVLKSYWGQWSGTPTPPVPPPTTTASGLVLIGG